MNKDYRYLVMHGEGHEGNYICKAYDNKQDAIAKAEDLANKHGKHPYRWFDVHDLSLVDDEIYNVNSINSIIFSTCEHWKKSCNEKPLWLQDDEDCR